MWQEGFFKSLCFIHEDEAFSSSRFKKESIENCRSPINRQEKPVNVEEI